MIFYKCVWEDRHQKTTRWVGTKADLSKYKAEINQMSTKRPYDQIDMLFSGQVDVPTSKEDLLDWLNAYVK